MSLLAPAELFAGLTGSFRLASSDRLTSLLSGLLSRATSPAALSGIHLVTNRAEGIPFLVPVCALQKRFAVKVVESLDGFRRVSGAETVCLVVFDVDGFGKTAETLHFLVEYRRAFPRIPLILCSQDFLLNQASYERHFICDYSLRLPASEASLSCAIAEVCEGHMHQG